MGKRVDPFRSLYQERAAKIRAHVTFTIPKYQDATAYQKRKVREYEKLLYGNGEPGIVQGGVFAPIKLRKAADQKLLKEFSGQPQKKGLKYVYVKTVLDENDKPIKPKITFTKDANKKTVPKIEIGTIAQTSALFNKRKLMADPRKEMERVLDSFGALPENTLFFVKNGGYAPGIKPGVRDVVIDHALSLMKQYDSASGGHHWKDWMLGFSLVSAPTQKAREDFLDQQKSANERQKVLDLIRKTNEKMNRYKREGKGASVAFTNAQNALIAMLDHAHDLREKAKRKPAAVKLPKPRRKHKN